MRQLKSIRPMEVAGSSRRGRETIGAPRERSDADGLQLKPRHVELLRQLNWLDFELYDYCAERRPN